MSTLAAIRPDSWNVALLLHVLGAMILVGGLLAAATLMLLAHGEAALLRLGYWSLLAVGLPGYVLMRIGAGWTYAREHLDDLPEDPDWIGIGYATADVGALLLLIALVVGGIGVRRLHSGGGSGLLKASMVLSLVLLAAYLVAVWAMSSKPV
jgi:hypothetical protein